jgi:hypothetical protein
MLIGYSTEKGSSPVLQYPGNNEGPPWQKLSISHDTQYSTRTKELAKSKRYALNLREKTALLSNM